MDREDLPDIGLPPTSSDRTLDVGANNGSAYFTDDGTFAETSSIQDDSTVRTHDQLPAVEAYKSQNAPAKDNSRRLRIILASILTMILAIVLIGVGVAIGRNRVKQSIISKNDDTDNTNNTNTTLPTSTSPSDSDGKDSISDTESRFDEVATFVSTVMGWSEVVTISNPDLPQYKAAKWIADIDLKRVPMEDSEEFRSRYALAVFYYATRGGEWRYDDNNWMTQHHACLWQKNLDGIDGHPVEVGVHCLPDTDTVTKIFLPSMDLYGELPSEIGLLTGLEEIDLFSNDIFGSIPSEMRKLTELTTLGLHENHLSGSIPLWFAELKKLDSLDLAVNDLKGSLPVTLGDATSLTSLNLENNEFSGSLSPLKTLHKLKYLSLGNNQFFGEFTAELLADWQDLEDLDMSDNKFAGPLPGSLFGMESLVTLDLHGNEFSGELPTMVLADSPLEFLALHENKLGGQIDSRITKLGKLRHLDLSRNTFSGDLPASLATLVNLEYLFLAFNEKLNEGSIPAEWLAEYGTFTKLRDFSLQSTNRIGPLPKEIGHLTELVLLDLADNGFSGPIPPELGSLEKLTFLILKDNVLSSEIPDTFSKLTALDTIVIDNNELTGGTEHLCQPTRLPSLDQFVADCSKTGCTSDCCDICCTDLEGTKCSNMTWYAPQDPVADYQFERVSYKFHEQDVVYTVPGKESVLDQYDTFGIPDGFVPDEVP